MGLFARAVCSYFQAAKGGNGSITKTGEIFLALRFKLVLPARELCISYIPHIRVTLIVVTKFAVPSYIP